MLSLLLAVQGKRRRDRVVHSSGREMDCLFSGIFCSGIFVGGVLRMNEGQMESSPRQFKDLFYGVSLMGFLLV